jgi:chromosome segregation ATPase
MAVIRVLTAVLALGALANAAKVTPVQKVLDMMAEMKAKGEKMMEEEAKTYRDYADYVRGTSLELELEIKQGKSDIEKYTGAAAKADSDVAKLSAAIKKAQSELAATEAEKAEATEIRNEQHAEYVKLSTDYGESVDALERAIQTMESKNYNVPEAEAFLQKEAVAKAGMRRVLAIPPSH